jgi:AraC-like DNA-binding protein
LRSLSPYLTDRAFPSGRGAAAFAEWREDAGGISRVYEVSGDIDNDFHAGAAPFRVGEITVVSFDFSGLTYERTPAHIRRLMVDDIAIQLNSNGQTTGRFGDVDMQALVPSVSFMDMSKTSVHRSSDMTGVSFVLPRRLFAGVDISHLHGAVAGTGAYSLLNEYAGWLSHNLAGASWSNIAKTEAAVAGVVSACFRRGRVEGPAREALGNIALERALGFIEANCSRASLNVDEIVAAVGVSRATLYRLFAPLEGVASCIRAARLERARALLSDPAASGTIASIAYRCGFADPLHFSRAFTDFFGFRPSNLRPF